MELGQIRKRLIEDRLALDRQDAARISAAIITHFQLICECMFGRSIGCYWPIKGEVNSVPLMMQLHKAGSTISLPVVDDESSAVGFKRWHPEALMTKGALQIPYPVDTDSVQPKILIVPLVGFDNRGYRLGYGTDSYDTALRGFDPPPITIGLGYEAGLLGSVIPGARSVPIEFILTEQGVRHFRDGNLQWVTSGRQMENIMKDLFFFHFRSREERALASPVCYAKH
ncbi:5-formyltetrahydrofolate cyclo-ligase [Methylobacillus rhizosphaerae]|uniref:5-formyltetrahydrofolate cyclo-ligase n=2 Tax=Methylobacillus rhizosphaerae TaxID=551994 RepID=A0A238ZU37_9PROT|nr:5-formyltetrahydrofolate cyclo-ligase [Methylobacillus rhizosphaerae]